MGKYGEIHPWWGSSLLEGGSANTVWAVGAAEITRGQARAEVAGLVNLFAAHGVRSRSAVALQIPPSFTSMWSLLALWSLGAQVMLFDHRLAPEEAKRLLRCCRPQFHVYSGHQRSALKPFQDEREVIVKILPDGRLAQSDHVLFQFSSGSTGHPKVISRTPDSLMTEVDRFARLDRMPGREERVLLLSSLNHSFGLLGGFLHCTNVEATLIFPGKIGARDLLAVTAEQSIDAIFGVPAHFDLVSRVDNPPSVPRLRLAVSGGEMLPAEVFNRFEQRYRLRIGQAYGMTEVGIIATDLTGQRPPPWVGIPVPGLPIAIRDGELYVRMDESPYPYTIGPTQWLDGWLRTFDLAEMDQTTGCVAIKGRSDSVVVIGGLNVDLMEVEEVLRSHREVDEAVVVYRDVIEAHVASTGGSVQEADLLAWCRQRLGEHKVPRRFKLVPHLPRTSNGKLIRSQDLLHAGCSRHLEQPRGLAT